MIAFAKGALTGLVWCGLLACAALVVLGLMSVPESYHAIDQQIASATRWQAWTLAGAAFGGVATAAALLALIELGEGILNALRRPLTVAAPLPPIPPPSDDSGTPGSFARTEHPAERFAAVQPQGFSEAEIRDEIGLMETEGQRYRYATPARLREAAITRLEKRQELDAQPAPAAPSSRRSSSA